MPATVSATACIAVPFTARIAVQRTAPVTALVTVPVTVAPGPRQLRQAASLSLLNFWFGAAEAPGKRAHEGSAAEPAPVPATVAP